VHKGGSVIVSEGVRLLYVRRYSVARGDRGDRFAKDGEDRKRSEEGLRTGSSRRREQDGRDHPDRQDHEPIRVPKKREEAHVERIPVEEGQAPEEIEVRDDEVLIPVTEEEIVVERREVVKEVLRVRKDVVEDEEVVGVDEVHEKDKHRDLDERGRRGSSEGDRRTSTRGSTGREEDRDRGARSRGAGRDRGADMSFIDKAKEALSGEDTRGKEGSRTRREDEPPRRRR
jgi:uncharacterized protein (TIGR02271 family)